MTFAEAFALHGPDTIAISEAMLIPECDADRLISEEMTLRLNQRIKDEKRRIAQRDHMRKVRDELRGIRAGRSA